MERRKENGREIRGERRGREKKSKERGLATKKFPLVVGYGILVFIFKCLTL